MNITYRRISQMLSFFLVLMTSCSYQGEKVVPELILDVPDEIKPDIRNIILRVVADDMFPIEVDLARQNAEFIIPTGKERHISALVLDSAGTIRATGWTVNHISRRENRITLNMHIPPPAPVLYDIGGTDTGLQLTWTQYVPRSGGAFREYCIYRDDFDKVSEASSLISRVSQADDTTYADNDVVEGQDYFYRVYVREASGAFNISNCKKVLWQKRPGPPAL